MSLCLLMMPGADRLRTILKVKRPRIARGVIIQFTKSRAILSLLGHDTISARYALPHRSYGFFSMIPLMTAILASRDRIRCSSRLTLYTSFI